MPNRLAHETSPYLVQHADNPVDWYPWGPQALEKARRERRPILLSVGYSSCHWCHVMERESFEDSSVAARMNELFVSIKVDREERPDVDQVYMRAVQAMTGRGGWPLTVFLTPDGEPYYGGTYFPPEPRHGMPSFTQVLEGAGRAWRDRPEEVQTAATELVQALRRSAGRVETVGDGPSGTSLLEHAVASLAAQYDERHGGFGGAPKFPQPVTLDLLLRHHERTREADALQMAVATLRAMARGGIRDHLGGGFHRYAVDAAWLVPHFEKMLYDNALLARSYLDAYRITGDEALRRVAEETIDYLLSDLRSPEGGFYTARDADSEGEEGRFYLWRRPELDDVLGRDLAERFARHYGVSTEGNFEGRNILHLPRDPGEGPGGLDIADGLAAARLALAERRAERPAPPRDEKVLLGWNGMALRTLAEAGGALGREDYLERAAETAAFLLDALRPEGALLHTWKDGVAKVPAFLEDHAALGNALLSLHEATLDPAWLAQVHGLCEEIMERFWSEEESIFYDAPRDGAPLLVRARDPMDNATPSGGSLAAELLLRAGHLFGESRYEEVARRALASEAPAMSRYPSAFGRLLCVLDRSLAPPVEIAVVGDRADERTRALRAAALAPFLRNRTVTGRAPGASVEGVPVLEGRDARDGAPTAYLCRGYSCRQPVTEPDDLARQIEEARAGD